MGGQVFYEWILMGLKTGVKAFVEAYSFFCHSLN